MKKTLFTINIDNTIDLITNSSSELFILHEDSLETAKEMIASVYPGYLSEYEEVKSLRDSDKEQIESYVSWVDNPWHYSSSWNSNLTKEQERENEINKHISYLAQYDLKPEDVYSNWDDRYNKNWWDAELSEEGAKLLANKIDPDGKIFLLWSIGENPDWNYQEQLEGIAQRYHLG